MAMPPASVMKSRLLIGIRHLARAGLIPAALLCERPSMISCELAGDQPRAIHADIVKLGSTSSMQAAASRRLVERADFHKYLARNNKRRSMVGV
jgi:hypothetical protein